MTNKEPRATARNVQLEPLYQMTVDDSSPTTVTASALMDAWSDSAPEGVVHALDLIVGSQVVIIERPRVIVRRLR